MALYHKTLPVNARIFVDYDAKDVRFEYVKNIKHRLWEVYKMCLCVWAIIFLRLMLAFFIITLVGGLAIQVIIPPEISDTSTTSDLTDMLLVLIYSILAGFMVFAFPPLLFLLYWAINPDKVSVAIPKIMANNHDERYVSVYDKVPPNKQIKIPLFQNVSLEYWLKGDFKDKIQSVHIRELPYVKKYEWKKGKLGKEQPQEDLWEVIFTFRDIPTEGRLTVMFV